MVSTAMAVQECENGGSVFPFGNAISTSVQLKDQISCGNDYALKVRKPYTITKQRERWTEDEHRKFLEALKLYGRAWRKIEEHVGTKTAVQIRSHAQKFFHKVGRDPNGGNTNSEEPIEIPPPRPKRKPMHPYPRKLVHSPKKEMSPAEDSTSSLSPNLSLSEQENQSPKSVLFAMGSDMVGSSGSDTPDGSLSPVSSAPGIHDMSFMISEPNPSSDDTGSPSAAAVSVPDDRFAMKLESFSQDNANVKESSAEEVCTRSLKLFGRTVLVADSYRPPSPTTETCEAPLPSDEHGEKLAQQLLQNGTTMDSSTENTNHAWGHLPQAVQALYLMRLQNENSNLAGSGSATPIPLWPCFGGSPFPFIPCNKPEPVKGALDSYLGKGQDKCSDFDTQSFRNSPPKRAGKEPELVFKLKPSSRSAFSQLRISTEKCRKGFVPYKRSTAQIRNHNITSEEREEKRIQLSL